MKIVSGEETSKLCSELCRRLGDNYTGPYWMTMEEDVWVLHFSGEKGSYIATSTSKGLVVKNEFGDTLATYPDLKDSL